MRNYNDQTPDLSPLGVEWTPRRCVSLHDNGKVLGVVLVLSNLALPRNSRWHLFVRPSGKSRPTPGKFSKLLVLILEISTCTSTGQSDHNFRELASFLHAKSHMIFAAQRLFECKNAS